MLGLFCLQTRTFSVYLKAKRGNFQTLIKMSGVLFANSKPIHRPFISIVSIESDLGKYDIHQRPLDINPTDMNQICVNWTGRHNTSTPSLSFVNRKDTLIGVEYVFWPLLNIMKSGKSKSGIFLISTQRKQNVIKKHQMFISLSPQGD